MNKIEVKILNPEVIQEAEKLMVISARLTQRGHNIKNMDDFIKICDKPYSDKLVTELNGLPHPTLQKLNKLNVAICGISRRFLAQITRHQDDTKFVSTSLQYSNYSDGADFVVPYELLDNKELRDKYITSCKANMNLYQELVSKGIPHDEAAYLCPQGLRGILIISATPFQWKHIISQRVCNRNTKETQYVLLRIWEELYKLHKDLYASNICGPFCMKGLCKEGKLCCGKPFDKLLNPSEILKQNFSKLYKGGNNV